MNKMKKTLLMLALLISNAVFADIEQDKEKCNIFTKDTNIKTIISGLERNCDPNNPLECGKLNCFKNTFYCKEMYIFLVKQAKKSVF
jgi:hypothetical protein